MNLAVSDELDVGRLDAEDETPPGRKRTLRGLTQVTQVIAPVGPHRGWHETTLGLVAQQDQRRANSVNLLALQRDPRLEKNLVRRRRCKRAPGTSFVIVGGRVFSGGYLLHELPGSTTRLAQRPERPERPESA